MSERTVLPVLPLRTARLTLRTMQPADAEAFARYRNDPAVARYQLWDLPYTLDQAREALADQDGVEGIFVGAGTQIAVELDGVVIGDVYVDVDETGGTSELGYTLGVEHQGHGYAREAAGAIVEVLFDKVGVGRVYGELAPENVASQRVLEAVGLECEGVTKKSFFWRGEWTDNMSYATTSEEYAAWRSRPTGPPATVELVVIDDSNQRRFGKLATHHSEERFVASVLLSYADALFPEIEDGGRVEPWFRGIVADGEPAGFVMTAEVTAHHPEPYLWRFLIDRRHQRRGIGRRALDILFDRLRADGHATVVTSWVDGPGSPRPFYERLGFVPTGEIDDGEVVARCRL